MGDFTACYVVVVLPHMLVNSTLRRNYSVAFWLFKFWDTWDIDEGAGIQLSARIS